MISYGYHLGFSLVADVLNGCQFDMWKCKLFTGPVRTHFLYDTDQYLMIIFMFFSENARVMVLAATNRPSELDEAILRRFTQIFEIGIPVQSERSKILQVVLKGENVEPDIDYDHIARLCEGFTGSDILELCKQAAFYPIRELLDNERNGRTLDVSILPSVST